MVRILITGANGQLGLSLRNISSELTNLEIHCTDLPDLDLTNQKNTEKFINEINPSFIVNCAAYTAVDKAETEKKLAYQINAEALSVLGSICNANNSKLIHISTDYVFNGKNYKPYKESDLPDPVSVYGKSKLQGEKYLEQNNNVIIIRTSWLYSEYGNNFVKNILAKSLMEKELRLVNDQIGNPTYAVDLAGAIWKIISLSEKDSSSFIPGIYHYSNEGVASWYDFAKEILNIAGYDNNIIPVESSEFTNIANRPHYSVLSKKKIRETFNLTIPYWKESLVTCLRELKKLY